MNPFAAITDLPQRLTQPAVRDLAWALVSPPLLDQASTWQRYPLAESPWAHEPGLLADWLLRQDQEPAPLLAWLSRSSIRRLGLYYERLWQFALHAAPGVEILAANLPIRQSGHTLGELDLLLRDASGVHHLELAIKFYLGKPSANQVGPTQWIGPGSHDRLDLKLDHLVSRQLPLSAHPQARPALDALTRETIKAGMWVGGYLFYPQFGHCEPPDGVHPDHHRGGWLHRRDWPAFQATDADRCWQPLPRHAWLSPARLPLEEGWSRQRLQTWLEALPENAGAQLLVDLQPDAEGYLQERSRLFLVADDWPNSNPPS